MTPPTFARAFVFSVTIFCVSFVVAATLIATLEWYRMSVKLAMRTEPDAVSAFNPSSYQERLVVTSVAPDSKSIVALVYSTTAGQNIPMRLYLSDDTRVERRDAIIENGIVVGMTDIVPASIADVTVGTRAIGTLSVQDEGTISITDLLIGDPFPRP